MKTLVAFYETFSHAQQAATLLSEEVGIERERIQLVAAGAARKAQEYFDDVPDVMHEAESEDLGAGGGALIAVAVEGGAQEEAARAVLGQYGLVDLVSYDGRLDLEAEAEPTWVDVEAAINRHFEANYRGKGQPFDVYAPAYRLGYNLAMEGDEETWDAVSAKARHRWEVEQEGNWEQFADAVRFAWREVAAGPEALAEALGEDPIQTTKRGRLYQELHEDE